MNAKALWTYQQFKVKKTNHHRKKEEACGSNALEEEKQPEGNPEANVMHLADSHPHLAMLEPVSLF